MGIFTDSENRITVKATLSDLLIKVVGEEQAIKDMKTLLLKNQHKYIKDKPGYVYAGEWLFVAKARPALYDENGELVCIEDDKWNYFFENTVKKAE